MRFFYTIILCALTISNTFAVNSIPDSITNYQKIFKCDFYQYYESIKLKELEEVQKGDITINKTSLVEKGGDAEDLGYGDNVAFIFEKEDTEPIILVCFYYEKEFEENLINSLKTFEFIQ